MPGQSYLTLVIQISDGRVLSILDPGVPSITPGLSTQQVWGGLIPVEAISSEKYVFTNWTVVDGTGVTFTDPNEASTVCNMSQSGSYTAGMTVTIRANFVVVATQQLADRNPFLALDDMDIGIYRYMDDNDILRYVSLTDQEKALDAVSIINAAYNKLGSSPADLDSEIATALANRSFAGAKVTVSSGWTGSVQVGSKTQTGINIAADPVLADFPILYVSPEAWRLQYALPAAGSIEVNIAEDGTNVNLTIDWGDLSTPDVYTTTGIKSHAYASAGSYEVKITGSITEGNIQFSGAGANQLTAINAPLQGITGITSFAQTFYNCSSLTSLPADLFRYNTSATGFSSTFARCAGLTSLPTDLFRYTTAVTDFNATFYGCTGLTSLPADLFKYTTAAGNFISAFSNCTGLTSLPADLFKYTTAVTSFNTTFYNCSGLTSLPADLFKYTTVVTSFNSAFYGCSGLTSLPADLFRYTTAATNFNRVFYGCAGLTSLPTDLFRYNTAVTDFTQTFYSCTGLRSLPTDLFRYNTAAASFGNTFAFCAGLTSLPTDLFRYTTAAGNFISAFANCTGLTSLPTDLFRYTTAVTDFNHTFAYCTSLTSLPADLFRYTTAATSFRATFSTCIGLTLRSDIFGTDYANRFLNKSVVFTESFLRSSFTGTQGVAPELWSFDFGTGTPVKTQCFGLGGNSLTSLSNYASIPSGWIS